MVTIFFTDAHRKTSSALAICVRVEMRVSENEITRLKATVGHSQKQLQT